MNRQDINFLSAPRSQTIDRGTQTSDSRRLSAAYFLMKLVKPILCHNFLWDIDEPSVIIRLIDHRELFMTFAMGGCSIVNASCCAMIGCFMGHSTTVIAGEAVAGCLISLQAGHLIEKEVATAAERFEKEVATAAERTGVNRIVNMLQNILTDSESKAESILETDSVSDTESMNANFLEATKLQMQMKDLQTSNIHESVSRCTRSQTRERALFRINVGSFLKSAPSQT